MKILAYGLRGPENGGEYFESAPKTVFCPDCGSVIEKGFVPDSLKLRSPANDVSVTYDSRIVVTKKFKEFCRAQGLDGAIFTQVNSDPELFDLSSSDVLPIDEERSGIERGNFCETCRQYDNVVGGVVLDRKVRDEIAVGVFRTDISYGLRRGITPKLIVGTSTMNGMKEAGIRGALFSPAEAWFRYSITLFPITVSQQISERIARTLAAEDISIKISNINMKRPGNPFHDTLAPEGKTVLSYGNGVGTEDFCKELGHCMNEIHGLGPVLFNRGSLELGGGPTVIIGPYGIAAFLVGQ